MASSKRTVRAVVTSYVAEDGTTRHALRGDVVEVLSGSLAQFDEQEALVPQPVAAEEVVEVADPPKRRTNTKK